MAELFKNIYNTTFIKTLSIYLTEVYPKFNGNSFTKAIFDANWEAKELKERMRHISVSLHEHLTKDFSKDLDIVFTLINTLEKNGIKETSIEYMFIPDFIEIYGIEKPAIAVNALEEVTKFTSCEFAIRPFIIKYPETLIPKLLTWASHSNQHVRRLASEGCRPRLPWAMAIPSLKKDPSSILPILNHLKTDSSEYVRRSVANNLNDIAKDNPEIVIALAKKWKGISTETDWLVKHGCRTLLKQGIPEIMKLFGFGDIKKIKITDFKILTPSVKIGDYLSFSFQLQNTSNTESNLRLEYGLYYQKANGTLAKKVFKISEKIYAANSITTINRNQSFKIITTRKFHLGPHQVSLIINGTELETHNFTLNA